MSRLTDEEPKWLDRLIYQLADRRGGWVVAGLAVYGMLTIVLTTGIIVVAAAASSLYQLSNAREQILVAYSSTYDPVLSASIIEVQLINNGQVPAHDIRANMKFVHPPELHRVTPMRLMSAVSMTATGSFEIATGEHEALDPGELASFVFYSEHPNFLVDAENLPHMVSAQYRLEATQSEPSFGQVLGRPRAAVASVSMLVLGIVPAWSYGFTKRLRRRWELLQTGEMFDGSLKG